MEASSVEEQPTTVRLEVDEDRGIVALRQLDLTKLPESTTLRIDMTKASTGRWRLLVDIGQASGKARHVLGDRAMTLDDLLTDLYVFAGENMAAAVLRQQAAGAGRKL